MAPTYYRHPTNTRYRHFFNTFQWNSKGHTLIELDTLWYIVKINVLWFLWYQCCKYELNNENFHLEVTLLNAWRTTMFVGMEAKRDIYKYLRKPDKIASVKVKFKEI
jgi:hypothetical protein